MKSKRDTTDQAARSCLAGQEQDQWLAQLAWGLAHPVRARILRILLARRGCLCGELVEELSLAQSTVSQHLKVLRQAGLIQGESDGPRICYRVAAELLVRLGHCLVALGEQQGKEKHR